MKPFQFFKNFSETRWNHSRSSENFLINPDGKMSSGETKQNKKEWTVGEILVIVIIVIVAGSMIISSIAVAIKKYRNGKYNYDTGDEFLVEH